MTANGISTDGEQATASGAAPRSASLQERAARDLAARSLFGSFVYPALFLIVLGFTTFYQDHPTIAGALFVVLLVACAARTALIRGFDRFYARSPRFWPIAFGASTLTFAAAWGLFTMLALIFYEWRWNSMIVLLANAGIVAGAVTTLTIYRNVALGHLVLMIVPTVLAAAIAEAELIFAVVPMFTLYLLFLVRVAVRLNREYWEAASNTVLLQEHAADLEAANRELEAFAYSVSHDLRSPLRSINGFSQILLQEAHDKLDPRARGHLQRVCDAAAQMDKLIEDLLMLSRVSRCGFNRQPVNLSGTALSIVNRLRESEPERDISVSVEPGLEVSGDGALLDVAMRNLIDNAWKYTGPRANATIEIGRTKATAPDDEAEVYYVRDNGVGFDMKYSDRLFQPFQRLHSSAEFPGNGVGLATAQRAIERHGGRLWAEAGKGLGATFYFSVGR